MEAVPRDLLPSEAEADHSEAEEIPLVAGPSLQRPHAEDGEELRLPGLHDAAEGVAGAGAGAGANEGEGEDEPEPVR